MGKVQDNFYDNLDIVLYFGDYKIRIVHIAFQGAKPNWRVSLHNHPGFELHYIPSGKGKLFIGKNCYHLIPNSCYLIGPNVEHEQIVDPNDPMREYGLNFEISIKSQHVRMKKELSRLQDMELSQLIESLSKTQFWIGEEADFFKVFFETMEYELRLKYIGYYSNIQNILGCIIIQLIRTCSIQKSSDYLIPNKTLDNRRAEIIHNYFYYNYKNANKEELAHKLCISSRQLSREIKQLYNNQTFIEVLTDIRLGHATDLIETTKTSIETIAFQIGFSSASYFTKVFKSKYHTTPEQYRTCKIRT